LLARLLYLGGAAWLLWTLLRTLLHIRREALSGSLSHTNTRTAPEAVQKPKLRQAQRERPQNGFRRLG
jgi:hypothetical protein